MIEAVTFATPIVTLIACFAILVFTNIGKL